MNRYLDEVHSPDLNPKILSWSSEKNYVFLNERLPEAAGKFLFEMAQETLKLHRFTGCVVLASSGSTVSDTKFLKLVIISKSNFISNARAVVKALSLGPSDRWLQVLPDHHVGGLGIIARREVSSCCITRELTWDLETVKSRFETEAITHVSLVPTQVFDLIRYKIRPPMSMKALIVGGGFLNPEVALEAKKLGWPLLYSYGMTETSSMVSLSSSNFLEPLSGVNFRVREDGQLGIQSSSLASGRVCSLPEGQLTFTSLTEDDSWFWTEDRAQVTEKGIVLLGRHSDFVKIGGEGTDLQSLRQIHEVICLELSQDQKMDLTQGTAIWAIPSARLGHEIQLVVESAFQELSSDLIELQEKFNQQVLPNQRIRSTRIVQNIPRNELGKILWRRLPSVPEEEGFQNFKI